MRFRLLLVAALAFPLAGCKESFPVPLDPEPVVKLDPRLSGVWACVPAEAEDPAHPKGKSSKELFTVLEFRPNAAWYRIRTVGLDKANEEASWDGYPSTLGERTILNTWAGTATSAGVIRKKGDRVALYSYEWRSKDLFRLDIVAPETLKGQPLSPAASLRKTLQSHVSDPGVFKPWLVCTRARAIKS